MNIRCQTLKKTDFFENVRRPFQVHPKPCSKFIFGGEGGFDFLAIPATNGGLRPFLFFGEEKPLPGRNDGQ